MNLTAPPSRSSRQTSPSTPHVAALLALLAAACASRADDGAAPDTDACDAPPERALAVTSSALTSSVDCTLRTETAYVRGSPRTIQTVRIDGKAVTKATGHAFLALQKAADAAGVYLALNSGFRTMAEQEYLYGCYLSGRCNSGNLAARPGFSNHQSGTAIDVTPSGWLSANAARYGFVATVPGEPWHYEYDGTDPGGVCDAVAWVSPRDGGWYTNGVWLKARAAGAARVVYTADRWTLGQSTDESQDFALRYTFKTLGDRALTAIAYGPSGGEIGRATIRVRVLE
jgi:hypothetical protein